MKAGDLVQLCLDESVGLICNVEPYTEKGAYEGRLRYWVVWHNGKYEWSWENELDVISDLCGGTQSTKQKADCKSCRK